mgnify:CR=1 FL=1
MVGLQVEYVRETGELVRDSGDIVESPRPGLQFSLEGIMSIRCIRGYYSSINKILQADIGEGFEGPIF